MYFYVIFILQNADTYLQMYQHFVIFNKALKINPAFTRITENVYPGLNGVYFTIDIPDM